MSKGLRVLSYRFLCRNHIYLLAIFWVLSFLSGMIYVSLANPFLSSLMCRAVYTPVSIVGLVSLLFLPLFISAAAIYFRSTVLIFLICGVRGFFLGCCLYSVLMVFEAGVWLIAWLLMFSSMLFQIALLWFWLRGLSGTICLHRDFCICTIVAVVIGTLDYFYVSPFLQVLVSKL